MDAQNATITNKSGGTIFANTNAIVQQSAGTEDEEKTTSFYRTHYGRANQFIKGKTWQAMQEAGKYFERLKKWKCLKILHNSLL